MKRGSSKPCPGCGKVVSWRPANEVCRNCKDLLENAIKWQKQLSDLGPEQVIVRCGEFSHWNKYIHDHISGGPERHGRNLMSLFQNLAMTASRPSLVYSAEFDLLGEIDSGGAVFLVMPRPIANAIRDLHSAIQPTIDAVYAAGKEDGHNLLMRLATGDLSPNEFMEETERG